MTYEYFWMAFAGLTLLALIVQTMRLRKVRSDLHAQTVMATFYRNGYRHFERELDRWTRHAVTRMRPTREVYARWRLEDGKMTLDDDHAA
jgi:hypothetical protein